MRTSALIHFSFLLFTFSLFAVPAKNAAEPVAEGFPAWTGITPKNYIMGRVLLSDAELRQRITVVIEFDAEKTLAHMDLVGSYADQNGFSALVGLGSANWESVQIPRDVMVIYVARNAKTHDMVTDALKLKGDDIKKHPGVNLMTGNRPPVYENVTFEGAPDSGGKLPYIYVMGIEGKDPVYKAEVAKEKGVRAALRKVIAEQRAKIEEAGLAWRPFYGYVAEPKHFKDVEKALAKGKPLDSVEAKLLKSVKTKDAEKAKEAQMLYDGLAQTRGELVWTIECSYQACPHVAAYKLGLLMKYWPKTKKQMSAIADKIKANSGAQPLVKIYAKLVEWSDPNFECKNAGEAKKIVAELEKMKKQLLPLTSDKDVTIQNGALILDGMLDELITIIPTKVPQK